VGTKRILIVDDEAPVRDVLVRFFEGEGFAVCQAANGTDALGLVGKERFDVILTDLKMPGASGLDVLREIKRMSPETVVLIFTAYPNPETTVRALQLHTDGYITKPVNLNRLKHLVLRGMTLRKWEQRTRSRT
jgi:DNA-binding NtrC family response regulator